MEVLSLNFRADRSLERNLMWLPWRLKRRPRSSKENTECALGMAVRRRGRVRRGREEGENEYIGVVPVIISIITLESVILLNNFEGVLTLL